MKIILKDLINIENKIKNSQENAKFMTNAFLHSNLIIKMYGDPAIHSIFKAKNRIIEEGVCDIITDYVTHYRNLDSQEKFEETIYDFLSDETEQEQKLSLILDNLKTAKDKILLARKGCMMACIR